MSIHREKVSKDEQGSGLPSDSKKLYSEHMCFTMQQQRCSFSKDSRNAIYFRRFLCLHERL